MKLVLLLTVLIGSVLAAPGQFDSQPALFGPGRVVGGGNAEAHQFPYIVSLQKGYHFCGGFIISEDWVVTAAHCLVYTKFDVIAGAHDLSLTEESRQARVSAFTLGHSNYSGGVAPYDVAVIKVDRPFEFNQFVTSIRLPRAGKIHSGDVQLAGWGQTATETPNILQTVGLPIVPMDKCMEVIAGSPIHETNVCTGPLDGGISACSGDSGGPLVQKNECVGIVSWGYIPCGQPDRPSVYTRVSAHIAWINDAIKSNGRTNM